VDQRERESVKGIGIDQDIVEEDLRAREELFKTRTHVGEKEGG
jgi:hypothetical protein